MWFHQGSYHRLIPCSWNNYNVDDVDQLQDLKPSLPMKPSKNCPSSPTSSVQSSRGCIRPTKSSNHQNHQSSSPSMLNYNHCLFGSVSSFKTFASPLKYSSSRCAKLKSTMVSRAIIVFSSSLILLPLFFACINLVSANNSFKQLPSFAILNPLDVNHHLSRENPLQNDTSPTSIIIEEEIPYQKTLISKKDPDNQPLRRQRRQYYQHQQHHQQQSSPVPANISLGYNQQQADQGPWAPWTDLSECTKSCGGGVYYQTRVCLDHSRSCIGPSKRYFSCNIQECPEGTEDFRSNQCARFNRVPFDGAYYNWKPFYKAGGVNPCELNCKPESQRWYYRHARKVIDGTRCYDDDSNNICVDGFCVELGCDRVLGSNVKEDNCRVCGGDGSTCRKVAGIYEQNQGLRMGYNDMLYLPVGSTNIQIQEVRPTNNYLAIRNQQGRSYLNGKWRIQPPATYDIAGTKFHYERPHGQRNRSNLPEKLRALGPTNEPLFIQLLYQEQNQGVSYEYSIPSTTDQQFPGQDGQPPAVSSGRPSDSKKGYPRYVWIFGDYSSCSKTCGTGVQVRRVYCASMNPRTGQQEPVSDSLCDSSKRPPDTRSCHNDEPCQAQWQHGEWSECSCLHKVQFRNVYCSSGDSTSCQLGEGATAMAPDSECLNNNQTKPSSIQKCEPDLSKCPQWTVGEWTKCDAHCGVGKQTRKVRCSASAKSSMDSKEKSEKADEEESTTSASTTPVSNSDESTTNSESHTTTVASIVDDKTSGTTMAADTTTTMVPQDQVLQPAKRQTNENETSNEKCEMEKYVDDYLCDPDTKPPEEQSCSLKPCEELGSVEWVTSPWSSCDTDCGAQTQTRQVACVSRDGQVFPDKTCQDLKGERPPDTQDCPDGSVCSKSKWFSSEWSECSVQCGNGMQTRHVFCGHLDDKGIIMKDEDESKCNMETKPSVATVCQQKPCEKGEWFNGPAGPCSVPCGGGQKKRQQFCLMTKQNGSSMEFKKSEQCDEADPISGGKSEDCNVQACDADQLALIVDCKDTEFGCCPSDGATPADEDYSNCPLVNVDSLDKCLESEFGCCPADEDETENSTVAPEASTTNLTLALGPFGLGCPVRCANTQFGCCPDMITVANSSDMSECPMEETTTMMTTTMEPTTTTMMPTTTKETIPLASKERKCADDDLECMMAMSTTTQSGMVKDCSKSQFGCCPDGWNEASGPNGEGCEEGSGDISSFISSTISSVMSMFTTISGADESQSTIPMDCNLTEFGCCPNGKTMATGPRYYGCTCHDYPFGCCQDGFSPASGENLEGCLCERMLYGCCSDGRTPAVGPNQKGCDCESSAYGCCSDMITFAQGPNYHGCPCETMTYGCCPGSQIPARGPDFAGCSCADTPFGCCTDGLTVAYGPNFEGCPSGLPLDNKLNSEVCKLPMEAGPCTNFSVRWFFDNEYGTCNRFWYGGCQGNGNRFSSQEQCERSCVKPEGPERCLLPKITGPCNTSVEAYYFDGETQRCEQFLYGGCLGNTNRFETMNQCVQTCMFPEDALDKCDQSPKPGPCGGNYRRWYYRREEGRCKEFSYGGCYGNLNNFKTEDECQSACASRTPFEICMLPKAQGSCLGTFPRWYFDAHSGVCQEFTYSGCEGNKNRFVDRVSCQQLCNQTIPEYFYPTRGQQPSYQQGQHYPYSPHYYPQPPIQENEIIQPAYENVCALPQAHGPCRENIVQWYFDVTTRRCERFYYGGCGGNENRFNDREQCEQKCLAYAAQPSAQQDPCLEPKDLGDPQCQDYRHHWYYDVEDRRCHRFYYYGCGGNRNNFETEDECTARCVTPRERQQHGRQYSQGEGASPQHSSMPDADHSITSIEEYKQEHCFKQFDSGPCEKNHIHWYYDSRDGVCKEFIYGGCGGNENRFYSQQECQTKCWNSQDICKLSPVRGSCSANFTQWYYDHQNNECHEFEFSGCLGNANRFSSKDTCEQQCKVEVSPTSPSIDQQQIQQSGAQQQQSTPIGHPYEQQPQLPEQCRLPKDTGLCRGYFPQYYYNVEDGQCQMFIYGGCGGNQNRFHSIEECEQTCQTPGLQDYVDEPREGVDLPETVCFLKAETGPCRETQAKWWYDSDSHTCLPFVYGGCRGNKNRFPSFEQCRRFCMGVTRSQMYGGPPPVQFVPISSTSEPPVHQPYPYSPSIGHDSHPTQPQQHCEPMECHEENCILGIDYYHDSRGCPSCRCINPCNDIRCSQDMSCSVELFRDEITGKIRANAECRLRVKPGQCPTNMIQIPESERQQSPDCFDQCRSDADCRNSDKCCNNGCADICVPPESPGSTPIEYHGQNNMTYVPSQPNYYNYSVDGQQTPAQQNGANHSHADYQPQHQQQLDHSSEQQQQHYYSGQSAYPDQQNQSDHQNNGQNMQQVHPGDQHIYHTDNGQTNATQSQHEQQPNYPSNYPPYDQHTQQGYQDPRYYPQYYQQNRHSSENHMPHSVPYGTNNGVPYAGNEFNNDVNEPHQHSSYYPQTDYQYQSPYVYPQNGYSKPSSFDHSELMANNNYPPPQTTSTLVVNDSDNEVVLDCPLSSSDEQPAWSKDGLYIDQQSDHYEILSNGSLRIKNLEQNDRGMYGCMMRSSSTDGSSSNLPQMAYIPLEFKKPARISPGAKRVIAPNGMQTFLHCQVQGFPEPNVTWWRGDQMLAMNSAKYQQMPNKTLIIQQVDGRDIGIYTCRALNELGEDTADIELLLDDHTKRGANSAADELEIVPYDPNLFGNNQNSNNNNNNQNYFHNQQQQQQNGQPGYSAYQTDYSHQQESHQFNGNGGQNNEHQNNHQNNNHYGRPSVNNNNNQFGLEQDSITTEIEYWPKDYQIGTLLHMDCLVKNQRTGQVLPSANIVWYINSDIPLSVDETNRHHYMIMANNTLLIYHLSRADSGEYRCRANTGPQGDSYSSVKLQVENIPIPADCQDSPVFANCAMIVQSNYCRNPHYHKFCCRSCYIYEHKQNQQNH